MIFISQSTNFSKSNIVRFKNDKLGGFKSRFACILERSNALANLFPSDLTIDLRNYLLWQYRLWSFQGRDTKLESLLAKNQL